MKLHPIRLALLGFPVFLVVCVFLPPGGRVPVVISPMLFIASVGLLLNFPNFVPSLQTRPLYLHDIVVEDAPLVSESGYELWNRKRLYYRACRVVVNFTAACLITGFCEYGYTLWQRDVPTSYVEVGGVVGGVMALLNRTQHMASRVLLKVCHLAQAWDERRRHLEVTTLHNMSRSGSSEDLHDALFLGAV